MNSTEVDTGEADRIRLLSSPAVLDRAEQILALLPVLRQWVTARVELAGAGLDLSLRQYAALHSILEGARSPGELARLWQVTPAVLTGIVDRLERRGLVRREPDPNDRRRLRLTLTDDLASQLVLLSPDELAQLGRSLDLLQRLVATLLQQSSLAVEERGGEHDALHENHPGAESNEMPRHDLAGVGA